jgi:serine/threonine protein kinase/cephalosporin-C deacetylase-like acetyl esterase
MPEETPEGEPTRLVVQLTKGTSVGHCVIVEKIGAGGMGEVYLAEDTELNRKVALKFLSPHLCQDANCRARFKREAQAAAKLNHPNIVTIYEVSEFNGRPFFAMEHVEGQSLRELIKNEKLPLERVIELAVQICDGLNKAHEFGIIHRDIKPANILVNTDGHPKIADFGLASIQGLEHLTKAGSTLGTVAYMSPEQARGEKVDARTDLWSLGVVIYEMVTGTLPFRSEHEQTLIYSILHDEPRPLEITKSVKLLDLQPIINRLLKKDSQSRYSSASDLLKDLQRYKQSLGPSESGHLNLRSFLHRARKPQVAVPAVIIILALCFLTVWFFNRQAKIRWTKEELLPKINQLIEAGFENYAEAYKLAAEAEKYLPHDPKLSEFFSKIAVNSSIKTEPSGAKVYLKDYNAPESEWKYLGVSPIEKIRLPIGYFRWKMEKEGYETVSAVSTTFEFFEMDFKSVKLYVPKNIMRVLDKKGHIPSGMVRVKGEGDIGDFFIDEYEVTNKQFKEFIDKGGYQKKEYWKQMFIKDGKELTSGEAVKEFVDETGRPGPATWQAGDYPKEQDDYPVSGVSWYEAAAYAEFVGKSLPTVRHWRIASRGNDPHLSIFFSDLALMSNFKGEAPAPVGSYPSMTSYGAYDMAGNVREWCWNETQKGKIIRGGAWNDVTYMFTNLSQAPPFDRSPKNGFRCALYLDPDKIPKSTFALVKFEQVRDFHKEKPVSDSVFQIYKEQFSYDKTDLNSRVEWRNESSQDWIQEKITFNAAYENERVIAYLFLPKKGSPPYQTVIYFPGSGSVYEKSSQDLDKWYEFEWNLSFIIKNGRAVLYPVYKGTFERGSDALTSLHDGDWNSHQYTEFFIKVVKDLKRSIDYLETRPDIIDSKRLAYFGFSWGGLYGTIIPAVEDRLKASILELGGLVDFGRPAVNPINYVTRVNIPTLMLSGRYDFGIPYEIAVKPMLDLLGTPKEQKEMKLYETDHFIPRNEFIKETLGWLDRYLGPVRSQ